MDLIVDSKILALLFVANGAPVIAKNILDRRFQTPLDGGLKLFDGEPVLGHSKTIRGVVFSLVATTIAAPLLGIEWTIGLLIAATAMIGDLLSSFLKRRLKLPASSRAIGLDQLPEAVFPLLICMLFLSLTLMDVAAISAAFVVAEILLSKLLYRYHIRDRPY
ncbi:MAG: CDP-archaeol synthase [Rhizomicrobium sp.]